MASQITSLTVVYSTVYSGVYQRKHQSSASLAFVWGIHRGPVNSPQKWPVTRKMFPFDDVIMKRGKNDKQFNVFVIETLTVPHYWTVAIYLSDAIIKLYHWADIFWPSYHHVSFCCIATICSPSSRNKDGVFKTVFCHAQSTVTVHRVWLHLQKYGSR